MTSTAPLPGDRDHLESERDFLLTSLADLDREHAAGDLDDGDYERLRDDYTARAAAVLRGLDELDGDAGPTDDDVAGAQPRAVGAATGVADGRAVAAGSRRGTAGSGRGAPGGARATRGQTGAARGGGATASRGEAPVLAPTGPAASSAEERRTTWRWAAVVVVLAALAGVLVVQAAGDRGSGGISGEIRASSNQLLADARDAFAAGDAERALQIYEEVLAQSPTNLEALTYKAWVGRNSGALDDAEALTLLDDALGVSPGYPDAGVFRAVVLERMGRSAESADQLLTLEVAAVPDYMVQMVSSFGVTVAGSLAADGDPARANEVLDHVLELDPENLTALVTKGSLLAAVAQVADGEDRDRIAERAFATMDRAVTVAESRPDELPAALLARAEVRLQLDDTAGAAADVDRIEDVGAPDALVDRLTALRDSLTAA